MSQTKKTQLDIEPVNHHEARPQTPFNTIASAMEDFSPPQHIASSGVQVLRNLHDLEEKNRQLQARLDQVTAESEDVKHQLESQIEAQATQIILLSNSLLAMQNYAAGAVNAMLYTVPERVKSSFISDVLWFARRLLRLGPAKAVRKLAEYLYLKASNQFDAYFYAVQIDRTDLDAQRLLRHYISDGFSSGIDPSRGFNVSKYLEFYPDVKATGADPFSHYLRHGKAEGRVALASSVAQLNVDGDSVVRIYEDRLGGQRAAGVTQTIEIEDRTPLWWKMAEDPSADTRDFDLYDFRPEDAIPLEGAVGAAFMEKFALLSEAPDFAGAIAALNAIKPKSKIVVKKNVRVDASIVIPIYGQLSYTLNALHSLLLHESKYSFEIIIGDDRSPDSSPKWLPKLNFIRYLYHEMNGGFVQNCNLTSELARGKTVIMLNSDVRVAPGWLDEMIDSFALFPKAGMVGSKLFYPDGSLQEAGGIVWKDGSAWNYGRDDDPNRPRYCYARQIDYVSGCSIAVPLMLWREMKGFDPHYKPAYCEDVDLCFRIRAAGYETWMQPLSRIIHYEGKTSGTDTGHGVKAYQVSNMVKLYERWKETLLDHRPNAQEPWLERDRKITKRVLVIDACNPTPRQDAGSVSIINLFRYYRALDYQVSFVPENFLYQSEEVAGMQRMGVQCFYAPFEMSMQQLLQKYGKLFDIIHVIRADVAFKCLDLIRTFAPEAKLLYQNSDLHYLRMERQAAVENKPALLKDAEAMKIKELYITSSFDVAIVHSDVELKILKDELPDTKIMVMPLIEKIIDNKAAFAARRDIMFLGGYAHPPNVDAAMWLIDEIWPSLSKAMPQARLLLVGARPPKALLDRASERIIVTGMVDDLGPWFDKTRLFVAALRYGAGSKGKVLASLAHGVPVIATDIAAEGLSVEDGKTIFIANSPEEIISKTLEAYRLEEAQWKRYSKAAKDYISQHHSFEAGVALLKTAIDLCSR